MTETGVMGDAMDPSELLDTVPGIDVVIDRRRGAPGAPALVLILECRRPSMPGFRLMLDDLDEVIVGRRTAPGIERGAGRARVFVGDGETSREHLALRRSSTGWDAVDLSSRNGTLVNGERIAVAALVDGDLIEAGGAMFLFVDRPCEGEPHDHDLAGSARLPVAFRTLSAPLERRIDQVIKIAVSPVPVLVRGETGTGKELLARAIHEASGRRGPFVPVNCGALPRNLIESELFGHRRGAFSGASEDREGLVRRAHQGTLFLDEIAELPPDSQVALLRVLQEGEVRPVGASEDVRVDVRVIAATHQDLQLRIHDGRFRQDLYGRIAGFEVQLPGLRDRREDLGLLIGTILARLGSRDANHEVALHRVAARALLRYSWPLNIRELEQMLRSAVALCDGGAIGLEHLPETIRSYQPAMLPELDRSDRALRERVIELLRETEGNVAAVGRAMDRAPNQIRRWCRRLGIDLRMFRSDDLEEISDHGSPVQCDRS
jgi:DNA-binding NtrC family response regulator